MRRKEMNRKFLKWLKVLSAVIAFTVCFGLASSAHAAYKIGTDDTYLKIGGLLQVRLALIEEGAPNGESLGTDFYIRRMRLMFYGQLNEWVNFFIETDNPNFGKNGNFTPNTFIQDAYLEVNLHKAIQIDMGMLLVPFSHNGYQGATSLLTMDYHIALARYAPGGNKVWRDYGAMVRGMPLGKWFEYRVGVYNGVHGSGNASKDIAGTCSTYEVTNPDGTVEQVEIAGQCATYEQMADPRNASDYPRLAGRLVFNVFEPEGGAGVGGMFNDGLYIKKTAAGIVSTRKVLAIGFSTDWQPDLNVVWDDAPTAPAAPGADPEERGFTSKDYYAFAGDVFLDLPLGAGNLQSLNGQVNFVYYNHGDRSNPNAYYNGADATNKGAYTGYGLAAEFGYRYDLYQPLIYVNWYESEGAWDSAAGANNPNTGDALAIMGGMNFWVWGHSCNFKIEFGGAKLNGNDFTLIGQAQAQLLF
jgi:hypothetical protein